MTVPDKQASNSQAALSRAQPISRRALFPAAIGAVAALSVALSLSDSEVADAQSKVDKKTAKYQDHPNKDQHCAVCRFFRPPKSCQLVQGDISPNGWCSFFAKKA
ncbi:MAG TPA: high-potential iron-sulfur protein [Pseudolabrys sp.]|nr:high-potential iron-sulfur protein [Pseudolabrys sp.]